MAKDTFYFPHDYHSRNDPKMVCLLMNHGVSGLGIYWCLVEMLYEQGGYLMLSECDRIAFELRIDSDVVRSIISCGLFGKDEQRFWSESALRRLNVRKQKSEKSREAAFKKWENMRTHSESTASAIRPLNGSYAIKGKERKE